MERILLAEDDLGISEMVEEYLTLEGYEVVPAYDGEAAIDAFRRNEFQLVLLDLMLPKIDGMRVLKELRKESVTPVIIISAKDSDSDKSRGLVLGADDYMTKPFSLVELSARIKANIRRVTQYMKTEKKAEKEAIIYRDIVIDVTSHTVTKDGELLELTPKEYEILSLLAANPGRAYSKEQIYQLIWGEAYYGDDNVINVHIRRLREKIGDKDRKTSYIKTLWGMGYKMEEVR